VSVYWPVWQHYVPFRLNVGRVYCPPYKCHPSENFENLHTNLCIWEHFDCENYSTLLLVLQLCACPRVPHVLGATASVFLSVQIARVCVVQLCCLTSFCPSSSSASFTRSNHQYKLCVGSTGLPPRVRCVVFYCDFGCRIATDQLRT